MVGGGWFTNDGRRFIMAGANISRKSLLFSPSVYMHILWP